MTAATIEPASKGPSTTDVHESIETASHAEPSGVLQALRLDLARVAQATWALVLKEGRVIGPPRDDGTSTVAGDQHGGS